MEKKRMLKLLSGELSVVVLVITLCIGQGMKTFLQITITNCATQPSLSLRENQENLGTPGNEMIAALD